MDSQGALGDLSKSRPKLLRSKKKKKGKSSKKSSRPRPILRLPTELVILIFELLDLKDQASLARANRFFYSIINPLLYIDNVKLNKSSCIFWGAARGELGTLKHALDAGGKLDLFAPYNPPSSTENTTEEADTNTPPAPPAAPATQEEDTTPWATPLHLAVKHGHRDVVDWMLHNGARIDAPSFRVCECRSLKPSRHPLRRTNEWPCWRALHTALCHEERTVAELLIFRGASLEVDAAEIEWAGRNRHNALHSAAAKGIVPIIKLLALDDSFDVNQRDSVDNTALHYVANIWAPRGSAEIRDTITKLLALGAELEAHNETGHTPLLHACFRGNYAVAHQLVGIGANPEPHANIPNFRDLRPLYYCLLPRSEFFHLDDAPVKHDEFEGNRISLINALIEAGADVDARFDKRGHRNVTSLMVACEVAEPRAVAALIKGGASVNAQDRSGRTPLFYVCSVRVEHRPEVPEITTLLIRHGARIDLDDDPNNPLNWAMKQVRWGESNILEVMLKAAGKMNLTESKLRRALEKCASGGNPKALKALLDFGSRTYGVSEQDINLYLDLVIQQTEPWNQRETFNCLMNFGCKVDPNEILLLKAITHKNKELSLAILERGVDVSGTRLYGGQTYLHLACRWGEEDLVQALLDRAANVNAFDDELRTPLSIAVMESDTKVAQLLMKEVADPFLVPSDDLLQRLYPDDDEWRFVKRRYLTAFDLALRETHSDNIDILTDMLSRYNLPEIQPKAAFSYIHRACQNPNPNVLSMLLQKGADATGGPDCSDPPFVSLLRHVWRESNPAIARAALWKAELLFRHGGFVNGAWDIMVEIFTYLGKDDAKLELRRLVTQEIDEPVNMMIRSMKGDGPWQDPSGKEPPRGPPRKDG